MSKTFVIAGTAPSDPPTELSLRLDTDREVELVAAKGFTTAALGYFNPRTGKLCRYTIGSDTAAELGITLDANGRIAT